MKEFIARYGGLLQGVVSGWDRLVLRGSLRALSFVGGMRQYLWEEQVLLKDFGSHVEQISRRLKEASVEEARRLGRPVRYLPSSKVSKEEIAQAWARERPNQYGLLGVMTGVEGCRSFEVHRNREARQLELVVRWRKCLFLYHYWQHPVFGMMSARIQSWFPFPIQVCLNGRAWLAEQMKAAGLRFARADNCFVWVEDFVRAQKLAQQQLRMRWVPMLREIRQALNPLHEEMFQRFRVNYYWSTYQSEWATDLVFRDAQPLRELYPGLVRHSMSTFGSGDVLRFLGRPVTLQGEVRRDCSAEVGSDLRHRPEGMRIKHRVDGNSVKAYDKAFTAQGSVLRVETTVNDHKLFRVYRPKEGDPQGPKAWRELRKGIADLARRAQVSQQVNDRYLRAWASLGNEARLVQYTERLERPVCWQGHRFRALHPFAAPDQALLQAISRNEFTLSGFRNPDLQALLFSGKAPNPDERKRRSARVSRQLRLLRAHGLIRKVPCQHRYHLTAFGRQAVTAILAAQQCKVSELARAA